MAMRRTTYNDHYEMSLDIDRFYGGRAGIGIRCLLGNDKRQDFIRLLTKPTFASTAAIPVMVEAGRTGVAGQHRSSGRLKMHHW